MHFSTLAAGLALMSTTGLAQYVLEDDYFSGNFFDHFSFFTAGDPTHGFVRFQDQSTSESQSLINSSWSNAYIGVDHTNVAPNGRSSVRLTSNKAYNTGLVIIDLEHMPAGCGTWPAFWMVGSDWPSHGEIDIIEGVHTQSTNDMTLHTNPGCSITNNNVFSGSISTSNCDVNAAGQGTNQGCMIGTTNTNTYGSGFNANGGGIYATEITSSAISIFFFEHGSAPSDIHSSNPNPSNWGRPIAQYQGGCDIAEHFTGLQLVFDTTFCGDWAGAVWNNFPTCSAQASTCNDFVQNHPGAFADAYWSVNSLKVYSAKSGTSWAEAADNTASSAAWTAAAVSEITSDAPTPSATTFALSTKSQILSVHTPSSAPSTSPPEVSSTPAPALSAAAQSSVEVQMATKGWEWDGGAFEYPGKRSHEPETVHQHMRHHQRHHHGAGRL